MVPPCRIGGAKEEILGVMASPWETRPRQAPVPVPHLAVPVPELHLAAPVPELPVASYAEPRSGPAPPGRSGPDRTRATGRRLGTHSARSGRSPARSAAYVVAVVSMVCGVALGAHVFFFYQHSIRAGTALIRSEERSAAHARAVGACVSQLPPSVTGAAGGTDDSPGPALAAAPSGGTPTSLPPAYALLDAPSIGLLAPVVDGVGESQLSVAVGHVPASSWPGAPGTSVLAAHDVTWFSRIQQLEPGDTVSVVTPCRSFDYTVADHRVVPAGSPIVQTAAEQLVLITCYPLDALFLTSQRYVLDATLTRVVDAGSPTGTVTPGAAPVVPAPPPLAAQGLDLGHNPAPLGTLAVTGSPALGWQESSTPLDDEAAVLQLYFAAVRAAEQDQPSWWAAIAPTVPFSAAAPLVGAQITYNNRDFDPSLDVAGAVMTGSSLATEPVLAGDRGAGLYRISMQAEVDNGNLVVTGWTMTPA